MRSFHLFFSFREQRNFLFFSFQCRQQCPPLRSLLWFQSSIQELLARGQQQHTLFSCGPIGMAICVGRGWRAPSCVCIWQVSKKKRRVQLSKKSNSNSCFLRRKKIHRNNFFITFFSFLVTPFVFSAREIQFNYLCGFGFSLFLHVAFLFLEHFFSLFF